MARETRTSTLKESHTPIKIVKDKGVKDAGDYRARLIGSHNATVSAGQTVNLDWQIPDLQWNGVSKQTYFDGLKYKAVNSSDGDKVTFQVVDKDGITYPAGTVLEEFAKDWPIFGNEYENVSLYKARLIVGMYIRIIYTSTGQNDVTFIAGLFRHMDDTKDL